MSLLLDALKRAEQEKLTRQVDRPAAASERPAAPTPGPAANAPALELQPLAAGGPAPRAEPASGAQAAQAVFKAKMPAEPPRNRSAILAAAAAIVVLLIAAGAYVWYSIRSLPIPRPAAMARVRPAPIAAPTTDLNLPRLAPLPTAPAGIAPAAPLVPAAPAEPARAETKPVEAPAPARSPADELLKEPARTAQGPVKLARTEEKPRVPPQVEEGYEALLAGDLATARARYAAGLEADPANVDALLGLATVAARSGDLPTAASAYRRALALDPRNPTALAGLAALASDARPEALESQLRSDLALHPESSALQLTLGNLYASQGRWADAQAAYFEAHRLQPENADIAYNLAVSLDHLGQRRPAADFYRRALESRRGAAAQFDAAAAARRLEELGR